MRSVRRFIASRPVMAFVVLAFSFSYTVGIATLAASGTFSSQRRLPDIAVLYLGRSGVVFGPAVAAIIVTLCLAGRAGVAGLLRTLPFSLRKMPWLALVPPLFLAVAAVVAILTGTPAAVIRSVLEAVRLAGWFGIATKESR